MTLYSQNEWGVQHIAGVNMPNLQYDLVVGKPDGLLHFYKMYANHDSVWINTFTCDPQGFFSDPTVLHSYPYNSDIIDTLKIIRCEYKYNKVYSYTLIDSTLIVMTIDDTGNAVDHVINTHSIQFDYIYIYGMSFCLFDDNNIFTVKLSDNKIYRINLLSDEFTIFYEHDHHCHYYLYPFDDVFLLAVSQATPYEPNLFIDSQYSIHHIAGDNYYIYNPRGNIGNTYFPTLINTLIFSSIYAILYVEQDTLRMTYIDDDSGYPDNVLENDDDIVPLLENRYICITKLNADTGELLQQLFATFQIVDGMRVYSPLFPNITDIPNPRTLKRINSNFIVALSGTAGNPIIFTTIDLAQQQYHSNTISIDANPLDWKIYPAGNNFYMAKSNRVHTFIIAESQSVVDNNVPVLTDLSFYPNPFSKELNIGFKLTKPTKVSVSIFDIKGRKVNTLVDKEMLSNDHTLVWNGMYKNKKLPSGIYFIKVETNDRKEIRKALLLN